MSSPATAAGQRIGTGAPGSTVKAQPLHRHRSRGHGAARPIGHPAGRALGDGGDPGHDTPAGWRAIALNSTIISSQAGRSVRSSRQNAWSRRALNSANGTPCCSTQVK